MPIDLPEPFASALKSGLARTVCDAEATTARARYARGLSRAQVGRDSDARSDFESAEDELGDVCRVQLGLLDLRTGRGLEELVERARELAGRAPDPSVVRGQALHLTGLAESGLRRTAPALEALLAAGEVYRELGRRELLAQVEDSLGMLYAAQGRLDHALAHYALSLVHKTLCGDRYGTAITLGNLGRVHLRAGRPREAIDALELDLEIAREMGDHRGEARVLNDLGRALLDLEETGAAVGRLHESLELAREHAHADLQLYARKDLALALIEARRPDEARSEIEALEAKLGEDVAPHLRAVVEEVRGRWLLAQGDDAGLAILERATAEFHCLELPDLEIPTLLDLARALAERGLTGRAESCLRRALTIARRDGYARYLSRIREAMAALQLVESAIEETDRLAALDDEETAPDGYVLFESLGKGGFGEVFRAYDPQRSRYVALKRLYMERLYDVERRERLLATSRLELEAASRIRHPGVARVWAIGSDAGGGTYVVQDLVDGASLRARIGQQPPATVAEVMETTGLIANALLALHSLEVVHRDLKPENILLRRKDGTPVLVDFGIAHVPDSDDRLGRGTIVGTLGYMAPEQLLGEPVSPKADMYSLGVILYEWLTGRRPIPHAEDSFFGAIDALARGSPPSVASLRDDLPPDLVRLADGLLSREPGQRPSAAQVADLCQRIGRGEEMRRTGAATVEEETEPVPLDETIDL